MNENECLFCDSILIAPFQLKLLGRNTTQANRNPMQSREREFRNLVCKKLTQLTFFLNLGWIARRKYTQARAAI